MKKYSRLTDVQRFWIEALKKAEKDQKAVAAIKCSAASHLAFQH